MKVNFILLLCVFIVFAGRCLGNCWFSRSEIESLYNRTELKEDLKSLDPKKVTFYHWSRHTNGYQTDQLNQNDPQALRVSNFKPNLATKIIIHGFLSSSNSTMASTLRKNYLDTETVNVINVDWYEAQSPYSYVVAAAQTDAVGELVGDFVHFLVKNGANVTRVHLIGHSLGAHVAGQAGRLLKRKHGLTVGRITGLDPVLPEFEGNSKRIRLNIYDAKFVDVIHSNAGDISKGAVGIAERLGHADFYPNGGSLQPGCPCSGLLTAFFASCSHIRAWEYFAESIVNRQGFVATRCDDNYKDVHPFSGFITTFMGAHVPHNARGVYWLTTKSSYPYANGHSPENVISCVHHDIPGTSTYPVDVEFLLWTRKNKNDNNWDRLIVGDSKSLSKSHLDKSLPVVIFAHGWGGNGRDAHTMRMKNEYLAKQACNFISVNWGPLAMKPNYLLAVVHVKPVGKLAGNLIDSLVTYGIPLSHFHVVGFSLGAHVAGDAGAAVTAGKVPRITGLDPAQPGFSVGDIDSRLDTTDASFVDVIHTNSGTLLEFALSFKNAIGHVDFYPNGGNRQPGCSNSPSGNLVDFFEGCSHLRAPDLFIESIKSKAFVAVACDTYDKYLAGKCDNRGTAVMGENVNLKTRGTYYLKTYSTPPYAIG